MTFTFKKFFAVLAFMLASTASFAATDCCDGGDCCDEVVMPCCD